MPVIDASVGVAWLLPDESNTRADAIYVRLQTDGGLVTQHWHFEIRNALLRAERRRRMDADLVGDHLVRLSEIVALIETDEAPDLDAAFSLARRHSLSFYDALYLELALRRNMSLATLDSALERASSAEGLPALP